MPQCCSLYKSNWIYVHQKFDVLFTFAVLIGYYKCKTLHFYNSVYCIILAPIIFAFLLAGLSNSLK